LILNYRDNRDKQDTIRQAIQLGQSSDSDTASAWIKAVVHAQTDLWRALSDIGLGIGFSIAGWLLKTNQSIQEAGIWALAIGVVILCRGVARLLGYYLLKRPSD
jgi:hypothetical protein